MRGFESTLTSFFIASAVDRNYLLQLLHLYTTLFLRRTYMKYPLATTDTLHNSTR
jgi:hypothetical protein